ncbi:GNAT family N-acetyltransferase [Endozoicomonas sp. SM1973]|uniref:GNAT family N-acetyltransferase n=1 Tax=Spartinivicinus marinus TaxID=2994442 RepID=A0A853IFP1_9GAMM|nr:GNAT family N-acetyltransferase [Spartinivicinus marinus]MCX4026831.1 GNAT family N-acetyltransferase [Spartinivicinus marinus]NYZ69358.1 GNAT family N-acetyltransferase [Spartinivicinus marinus]
MLPITASKQSTTISTPAQCQSSTAQNIHNGRQIQLVTPQQTNATNVFYQPSQALVQATNDLTSKLKLTTGFSFLSYQDIDKSKLFSFLNKIWGESHSYYMNETHIRFQNEQELDQAANQSDILVLMDNEKQKIAGCIQRHFTYDKDKAYFGLLCIDDSYRGKKLADKLIDKVETDAQQKGHDQMHILVVKCADKLINYYHKKGYELTGKEIPREAEWLEKVKDEFKDKVSFVEMRKALSSN